MSDLGFLGKLLDGADVEWVPLGDQDFFQIANSGRRPVKSSLRVAGDTPYYGANNIQDYVEGHTHEGEYVLIAEDGSASLENYSIQYVTGKFWANNHVHVVRGENHVSTRYLFHYLTVTNFQPYLSGGGRAKLTKGRLVEIPVPIPCPEEPAKSLAIQGEIVRTLDSFTKLTTVLTTKLTTELEARKKQYNHYRDQLLTSEDGEIEWLPMEHIGEFIRGKRFTKADYRDEGIRAIHYGEIYTHYGVFASETLSKVRADMANSLRFAEKNDVVMAGVSETLEDVGKAVAWLGDDKVAIHDDSYAFRHPMNPKYIAYAMQTDAFHDQKGQFVSRGKIKRLLIDGMKKVKLPIPFPDDPQKSLAEQARIVAILDKFDALTTSLTKGLSREIELRQKQYQYYRDLLLTFPKPAEAAEA